MKIVSKIYVIELQDNDFSLRCRFWCGGGVPGGAPKVHEELHVQRKWMKEWRQVGRHLQAMEGERGDRIS